MDNSILISVIVPVYNKEKYLPECLDSITAQDYPNLEIILIDDGSTDKSGKICDEYAEKDERIRVIHQINAGVSAARNKGLEIMRGQYFTFIDSDDYWDLDYISFLKGIAEEYDAQIAICGTRHVDSPYARDVEIKDTPTVMNGLDAAKSVLLVQNGLGGSACRALFKSNDALRSCRFTNVKCYEDLLYMTETSLLAERIAVSKQNKYNYRYLMTGSASLSHEKIKQDLDQVTKQLEADAKRYTPELQVWIDQRYIKDALAQVRQLDRKERILYWELRRDILSRELVTSLLFPSCIAFYRALRLGRVPLRLMEFVYYRFRLARSWLHAKKTDCDNDGFGVN